LIADFRLPLADFLSRTIANRKSKIKNHLSFAHLSFVIPQPMLRRIIFFIVASLVWFLAVLGAIAVAVWLRLPPYETRLLVLAIAFIAFFGAFLPVARLGKG